MPVELMTQAQYAAHRHCSGVAVFKAVRAGRISLIDGKIDPAVADIQWAQNTRARAPAGSRPGAACPVPSAAKPVITPADEAEAPDYAKCRARREHAEAQVAEMHAARMRDELVLRADVDRGTFEAFRELRDRLTDGARRIGPELAGLTTAESCEAVVAREHRTALGLAAAALRAKLGPPVRPAAE